MTRDSYKGRLAKGDGSAAVTRRSVSLAFAEANKVFIDVNLDQTSFLISFSTVILCKLLILWSGRPGSNRRRPAWEKGRQLYLKHLFVSETLIRLTQALAVSMTSFLQPCNRGTNEVHPNVLLASIQLLNIPWARNDNGSRWNASHQPRGLNLEFLQQQFTLYRSRKEMGKTNISNPVFFPAANKDLMTFRLRRT